MFVGYELVGIVLVWLLGETVAYVLFSRLNKLYKVVDNEALLSTEDEENNAVPKQVEFKVNNILKGIIERLCLFLSFIIGFPQMLIAFGALKVGTKLGKECQVSNDYYLVGNLLSIIIVFSVYLICIKTGLIDVCPCS